MLRLIRKILPRPVLQAYHYFLAKFSAFVFGYPSEKLIVIGVTGTNGKSSTVQFISQLLTALDEKVGYTTTAGFSIAGRVIENKLKMTMPGRFLLQKLLRQMVRTGCRYAIIETSSQGVEQFRHLGINYDLGVFTNLTPEHIEAHGGFENYKAAKGKFFAHLASSRRKKMGGQTLSKKSIINADDKYGEYFSSFPVDEKITFSFKSPGFDLSLIPLPSEFEKKNVLAAVTTIEALGFPQEKILEVLPSLKPIAGRFEVIDVGQPFQVIVDYAYEPYALQALFDSVTPLLLKEGQGEDPSLKRPRIIGVHGSAGGGRDVARRFQIGELAAKNEAVVIVTNEDPYDEDPRSIIEEVACGAVAGGKIIDQDLFLIDDREKAIEKAISLAQPGDVVLLTGKGSEPVMAVANGQKIPWSDREVALRVLAKGKTL